MGATTIRVSLETKKQLDEIKHHPDETYEDVIIRLIDIAIDPEPLSEETLKALDESIEDIRAGRLFTLDEVRAELRDAWRTKSE